MSGTTAARRRLPVGAEVIAGLGTHFRVWAPGHRSVALVRDGADQPGTDLPFEREEEGYFSLLAPGMGDGDRYWLRLDEGERLYPDLASRFQPEGPHGPSQVVDPAAFTWTDAAWKGVGIEGQVLYEMHVGTFTPAGTWAAAAGELTELHATGITVLEVMPIADFAGGFGWGYDGVDPFAPTRLYGTPDDFRRFVDQAHAVGLGVILDVVYNHVGPDGAFFKAYSPDYFTDRYANEWGEPINFDGPSSGPVREFFLANAAHWIAEYHLDGLRLDATQSIFDSSSDHVIAALVRRAHEAAGVRSIIVIAENEAQTTLLAEPVETGGYGLDALWNDDFHHSAHVAMTGHNEAYFTDYLGSAQEFVSAAKHGYLYQGQRYEWQKKGRGTPAWSLRPSVFVSYLENHDQLANSARGRRVHQLTSPGRYRALTALMLLGPATPLLFQGQEFASSSPFVFFADHQPPLADAVRKGRFDFLAQFPSLAGATIQAQLNEPSSRDTFERCRLDFSERFAHREAYDMTRDLLHLRREDPVLRLRRRDSVDGAVLAPHAFVLRFFDGRDHASDRLLAVNLGRDLPLRVAPEPLLAPPAGARWMIAWSSENPRYGGQGVSPFVTDHGIHVPGEAAVLLVPSPNPAVPYPPGGRAGAAPARSL